jgi:FkbM family methyltransferase
MNNYLFKYFNRVIFFIKKKILFIVLYFKINKYLRNIIFSSSIKSVKVFNPPNNLLRLGTKYGGWTFLNNFDLKNSTIISCGAGEDISFDIDFINYYDAKVILVDPTPKAIIHYNEVIRKSGQKKKINMFSYGKVNCDSYDLTNINKSNLFFVNKAVDISSGAAKFYSPKISTNTSSSLIKEGMYDNKSYILVDTISIKDLIIQYDIQNIPLIKLDIKKKEIEVIKDLIIKKIFPKQILVDFEGLFLPSKASIDDFKRTHEMLLQNNYKLTNIEGQNYSYAIF